MTITYNKDARIAEIWLTTTDQTAPEIEDKLNRTVENCKKQGYLAVVFRSGTKDLYEETSALLRHNRKVTARDELAQNA